jgi:hypothetical protein
MQLMSQGFGKQPWRRQPLSGEGWNTSHLNLENACAGSVALFEAFLAPVERIGAGREKITAAGGHSSSSFPAQAHYGRR